MGVISIDKFCNNWFGCSYFDQLETYLFYSEYFIRKTLRNIIDPKDFLKLYAKTFSSKVYNKFNKIDLEDNVSYKNFCLATAKNTQNFLNNINVIKLYDRYNYKVTISAVMDGVISINNKTYNLLITTFNSTDLYKIIDKAKFNNYIYNYVTGASNNCLLFSAQSNSFYVLYYFKEDYILSTNFIKTIRDNKQKSPGYYCLYCKNKCNAYIKNLDKLKEWNL